MKQYYLYLISVIFLTMSCRQKVLHSEEWLSEVERLSDSIPSEALTKLGEVKNVNRLSRSQQAEYNLLFIKSMIRSGNKLSSDSLIHITSHHFLEKNDSSRLHQLMYYNGIYHYRNAMHDSAIYWIDMALNYVPSGYDYDIKARYKQLTGYAYLYLNDTELAINAQNEGLSDALLSGDSTVIINSMLSLAEAYKYNKEITTSLETYFQALDLIRKRNNRNLEANILNIVSEIYESEKQFKEALHYKNMSQDVKRNRYDVPAFNLYRSILFRKQNMLDSALYYATLSSRGDDPYVAELAYRFIGLTEAKKGRYTEALQLSKNSERIFNSFMSGVHGGEMQQKYEKEKLENENNQLKIKHREHQFYLLLSLFFLVCMLIGIYIIYVNSKRKNEKIYNENKILRLKQENLLLQQQQEISALREKEAMLRESLFKKINFFHKLPSLNMEGGVQDDRQQHKIRITNNDWQELINAIKEAYPGFINSLKQYAPALSEDDVRFCCLLKINVNMQDLSDIYCVSKAAITKRKYRLKTEKFQIVDNVVNLDGIVAQIK